jgi:NAD(P)-dependent dehydrogenase (short-subunit alcohol dehydrogenase family)
MGNLEGQVAFVIGLPPQLAEAVATALADSGADVAIADSDPSVAGRIEAAVEAHGRPAFGVATDVGDGSGCREALEQVLDHWGRIDVVVSAVGLAADGSDAVRINDETFDQNCDRMLCLSRALVGAGNHVRAASIRAGAALAN